MTALRLALSHHWILRLATGVNGARTLEENLFPKLLGFVTVAARSRLSPSTIQMALLVLEMLLERSDLLDAQELFHLVDTLRQLMQARHRQLDVAAALLGLATLCLPALTKSGLNSEPRRCFLVILEAYT